MASFMSAITLLGVSNENYVFGTQFVVINLSYGFATPIAVYLFLPIFYNLRATSAYEVSKTIAFRNLAICTNIPRALNSASDDLLLTLALTHLLSLQYLEKRFGKYARLSASIAYTIQMVLYMGIVLYAPALAFESVIGIDKNVAIVIIGLTVIFYCCVGGIRAVL